MSIEAIINGPLSDFYFPSGWQEQDRHYQRCTCCLMDTIANPDISFDATGRCHYHTLYEAEAAQHIVAGAAGRQQWAQTAQLIREEGKDKKYDSILGLSGGVDSTYLCLLAKEAGLRPLVLHCDNSWNDAVANTNIHRTISGVGFDLDTYLLDWTDFRSLQLAYLRASVVNMDVISDHAFAAVLYQKAKKWGIRHVLVGTNLVTEQLMAPSWAYNAADVRNIKDIHSRHGEGSALKSFPFLHDYQRVIGHRLLKMKFHSPLNWNEFHYRDVQEIIKERLGWTPYPTKHSENIWTRFYQNYILPVKFGIDKRKVHCSNLIFSGQMTLAEAQAKLEAPLYDGRLLRLDAGYVLDKLGLSAEAFDALMAIPARSHYDYLTQRSLADRYLMVRLVKKLFPS